MTFFLWVVLLIILIASNRSLSGRINALETHLGITPAPTAPTMPEQAQPVNVQTAPVQQYAPAEPNKFFLWLKEDWLMKLGVFLFIIGFGWFVSYAFINNWIGPVGRISLGIFAGAAIMAFGFFRMLKYPSQGAVFLALGAGMAMLTIFAGRSIYGFFTPASAILIDFMIAAFVAFASYKYNVASLAQLGQILAYVTPLLAAGETGTVFLFSYLLCVSLASLFLASVTGWRNLITTSLIFVGMHSLPYMIMGGGEFSGSSKYYLNAPTALNFAFVFSMLYLFSGMSAVLRKGAEKADTEVALAVLNGLFLFLWIYNVAMPEWQTLIFAAWAIVFTVSSFMVYKWTAQLAPFYAYGAVAVGFIAAATAAELSGSALVVAFAIEIILLIVAVLTLTKNTSLAGSLSWLFIGPILLSIQNISGYGNSTQLFTEDFFALLIMALALVFAGRLLIGADKKESPDSGLGGGAILVIFGTFYLGFLVWEFMDIVFLDSPDMAVMASLIIYTVAGLIAYFAGLYGGDAARKTYGVGLLVFVVARLLLIDVWDMALFGRVVTFLAIGVLLMSTAFLTKRKRSELTTQNYQPQ